MSKLNSFIEKDKQPAGLNLAKLLVGALLKHDYSAVGQFHIKSMFLGMMHFQDKYNQDEERLQRCDIHYLTPDMRIIPFCSFNVIPEWYRDRIRSEEHTSELQSLAYLVCRLLLEKKKKKRVI